MQGLLSKFPMQGLASKFPMQGGEHSNQILAPIPFPFLTLVLASSVEISHAGSSVEISHAGW